MGPLTERSGARPTGLAPLRVSGRKDSSSSNDESPPGPGGPRASRRDVGAERASLWNTFERTSPPASLRRLTVLGQGHVGLRLALRAAEVGWTVVGYDTDDGHCKELMDARGSDGVPAERLPAVLATGRYQATADELAVAGFDVAAIAVPTSPPGLPGGCGTTALESAARLVGRQLRPGGLVVVESTVYPGATAEVVRPILEAESGLAAGADFALGVSPERIDTALAESDLAATPKLVAGVDDASTEALARFYEPIAGAVVRVRGMAEAELAKLVENSFRHLNVAFANEVAKAASAMGIDGWEALRAAATKPFGYLPFWPGPGPGGRCLASASGMLSWAAARAGAPVSVLAAAESVNAGMPAYVVERVRKGLGRRGRALEGASVVVLGLAYKPGVAETSGSAAVVVANLLAASGARVRAADPLAGEAALGAGIERVNFDAGVVQEADAVVLTCPQPGMDLGLLETARYVLDTRGVLEGPQVERL